VRVPTIELAELVRRATKDGRYALTVSYARIADVELDTAAKRVYKVLDGYPVTTAAETADELALAAGLNVTQEGLTHLATSVNAAREMVSVWAPTWTTQERTELTRRLVSFSRGFLASLIDQLELLHPKPEEAAA
jgi:hypothetical protein